MKIDFNYNNKISHRDLIPQLKSHHFQQVLQDVYGGLIAHKVKMLKQMKFKFEDKNKQKIYNYCKSFCFQWDNLEKYIKKQINKFKNTDIHYCDFIKEIQSYISDIEQYNQMKQDIETEFYKRKDKIECPQMKNPWIWCNTAHTIKLEQKNFYEWYFILDSNEKISEKRMKKMIIPIKYSKYHEKILKDKVLNNTFKIGLNTRGQIEIMATYNIEVDYPINEVKDIVGIDIGLKKLVVCSDGEMIDQNPKILSMVSKTMKRSSNRLRLQEHIRKKLEDDTYKLSNNKYLKQQKRLTNFVICDNRYRIKQFLKGRDNDLIVMEDLEIGYSNLHNKKINILMRRLHIQAIKDDLIRYCKEKGINVVLVNPAFTSQLCPRCGYVDKKNRKTQEKFSCVKCGYTTNADLNASENIRNRYYDSRITTKTPAYKVKELLECDYNAHG